MPQRKVHRPKWAGPAAVVNVPQNGVVPGLATLVLTVPARHLEHLDRVTRVAVRDCELEGEHIHAAALALRRAYRAAVEGVSDGPDIG